MADRWKLLEDAPLGVQGHVWSAELVDRTDALGVVHEYPGGERFVSSSFKGYKFTHWHALPEPPNA